MFVIYSPSNSVPPFPNNTWENRRRNQTVILVIVPKP
jgi:hypothetical protein